MILATAGHVDHGKTLLVKRLTGIDTDRLAEEKARGLTIDLGFAYKPLPSGATLGIVDVPGHERFVSNMLAGVGGIDCAMLAVSADDGPMPQTLEHIAILDLLEIDHGVVALTKIDRVEPNRIPAAMEEVRRAVSGTFLRDAPIFPVSSVTGEGVPELQAHLFSRAELHRARAAAGQFRMTVDRCFTIQGVGLVVTGSVFSGEIATGMSALVAPAGAEVRVRGMHVLDQPAHSTRAGDRVALNLTGAGARANRIQRGDWIIAAAAHAPTTRVDARLSLLSTEEAPLRRDRPVHFHFGAQDIPARIAVLESDPIAPGQNGLVRVTLDRPAMAAHGDRFVLRDQSAQRTIAGGVVLDIFGPGRGRARPARLEKLRALDARSPAAALQRLLALREAEVDLKWFRQLFNLRPDEMEAVRREVDFVSTAKTYAPFAVSAEKWRMLQRHAVEIVFARQGSGAENQGVSSAQILKSLPLPTAPSVLSSALAEVAASGRLTSKGQLYFLPGARKAVEQQADALGDLIIGQLRAGGFPPPTVNELSEKTSLALNQVLGFLTRASAKGVVRRVGERRFFLSETLGGIARDVEDLAGSPADGWFGIADFREKTGIGRRHSVELLEYFDRVGFTVRNGDKRRVARPASQVFGN
jgi:selenocysteine-specific elongation factor